MDEKRKRELAAARKVRSMDPRDVTIGLWLDAWRVLFPGKRSDETNEHIDQLLRRFRERHGRRLVSALTPLMAQEWATKRPRDVKELKPIWRKAVMMELVPYNVWRIVELPPRVEPPRPVPTPAQFEAALTRCSELAGWYLEVRDVLLFTAYTGARSGGVCGLKRDDVDVESRRVTLREKGGKERRVALLGLSLPAVMRALERPAPAGGYLFVNSVHRPLDRATLSRAWRTVRGDFPGPFHSLRHFAGTWLARNGVDERDIAIQLGHTDSMGRPYTHLVRRVYVHPEHEPALERLEAATRLQEAA